MGVVIGRCTQRNHVVPVAIPDGDERIYRCVCGLVLMGNGRCEIRFGLLDTLYPAVEKASEPGSEKPCETCGGVDGSHRYPNDDGAPCPSCNGTGKQPESEA